MLPRLSHATSRDCGAELSSLMTMIQDIIRPALPQQSGPANPPVAVRVRQS
jgi:hypothetical protein